MRFALVTLGVAFLAVAVFAEPIQSEDLTKVQENLTTQKDDVVQTYSNKYGHGNGYKRPHYEVQSDEDSSDEDDDQRPSYGSKHHSHGVPLYCFPAHGSRYDDNKHQGSGSHSKRPGHSGDYYGHGYGTHGSHGSRKPHGSHKPHSSRRSYTH